MATSTASHLMGIAAILGQCILGAGIGVVAQAMLAANELRTPTDGMLQARDGKSVQKAQGEGRSGPRVRLDQDGEPLPAEAIARLGTTRFRHGGLIDSLVFTPDGNTLLSCGSRTGARFWEAATGKEIARFREQPQAQTICLSPDGKLLAVLDPQE